MHDLYMAPLSSVIKAILYILSFVFVVHAPNYCSYKWLLCCGHLEVLSVL